MNGKPISYEQGAEAGNSGFMAREPSPPPYGGFGGVAADEPANVMELIAMLKRGLPYASFQSLQDAMNISAHALAETVNIAPRTLARRKKEGRFQTDESERLWRLVRLFGRAETLLGGAEARRWMQTPKRALAGKTPLQFADTEPGAQEVRDLLGRLEHGVFS